MGWTQRLLAACLGRRTRAHFAKIHQAAATLPNKKYKLWHWPEISINCEPDSDQFDYIHAHKHTRIAIALDMPGVWFYFLACRQFGCQSVDRSIAWAFFRWIAPIRAIAYMGWGFSLSPADKPCLLARQTWPSSHKIPTHIYVKIYQSLCRRTTIR